MVALQRGMSLNAAVLDFAGDHDGARRAAEPQLDLPADDSWSPMPWSRRPPANEDVVVAATHEPVPVIHSTDSGLMWVPTKR